jgi:hypothetical protein
MVSQKPFSQGNSGTAARSGITDLISEAYLKIASKSIFDESGARLLKLVIISSRNFRNVLAMRSLDSVPWMGGAL